MHEAFACGACSSWWSWWLHPNEITSASSILGTFVSSGVAPIRRNLLAAGFLVAGERRPAYTHCYEYATISQFYFRHWISHGAVSVSPPGGLLGPFSIENRSGSDFWRLGSNQWRSSLIVEKSNNRKQFRCRTNRRKNSLIGRWTPTAAVRWGCHLPTLLCWRPLPVHLQHRQPLIP